MATGGRTGRFGGAGYDSGLTALLAIDVDLSGLDRGLDEGRRRTANALNDMGNNAERFSRRGSFAMQNFAFQMQDVAVQIASGQGAIRALAQNLPQLLVGFGTAGAVIGAVVAVLGGFVQAIYASRDANETLDNKLKETADTLDALAERYRAASEAAQAFAGAELEFRAQESLEELQEQLREAQEAIASTLGAIETRRGGAGFNEETAGSIRALATALRDGEINAIQFRREIEALAQTLPEVQGDRVRDAAEALITAANNAEKLKEAINEIEQGLQIGGLAKLRDDVVELRNDLTISRLPENMRDLADAVADLGLDVSSPEKLAQSLARLDDETRKLLTDKAQLTRAISQEKGPSDAATSAAERQTDAIARLTQQTIALRQQREALARGGPAGGAGRDEARQVQDLAEAAARFNLTIDQLKDAPPAIREAVQAYVEERAALRDVEAGHKAVELALEQRNRRAGELFEEQKRRQEAELDLITEQQREASRELESRAGRIEAGGRLPDDIDAANLAARNLADTLTDIDNLTFDSLLQSLASIGESLAAQIIQALIFRAIMASIGGVAPGTPVLTGLGTTGAIAPIPGRAGGGPTTRGMPYWVGEFGRELHVPTNSGRVISSTELEQMSGSGGTGLTYNLHAERIDPGTISWLLNTQRAQTPNVVVNAQARGQMGRGRAPF